MNVLSLLTAVLLTAFRSIGAHGGKQEAGRCTILLWDDGPAVLEVPVEVTATLLPGCPSDDNPKDEPFEFLFDDSLNGGTAREPLSTKHRSVTTNFIYQEIGTKMVNVRVFRFGALLAQANTTFQVNEYISGKLSFNDTIPDSNERHFAATNHPVQISLQLHLPQRIMSSAEFTYSWNIEDVRRSTSMPQIIHRFQNSGRQWIRAAVVARLPPIEMEHTVAGTSYSYKWGYFEGEIYIKDPFDYINITGNTYLEHGQLLNLDIACNGSGPVDYCWKVLPPSKNQSLSCTDPVTIPECRFPILYYFRDTGEFLLAVHVDNVVSQLQKHIRIQIYDVSLRPQLSTVIVPVVCTVLVLFIIATAVMVHLRRQPPDIETADFDFFRTERGNVILETSLEHMLRMLFSLCYGPPPHVQRVHYGSTLRSNSDSQ